ncbi:MAG: Pyrrolo-quinoline quinone [Pedosphaera sp.]|nr:Pyrrolo-quinoline quinone [Pedosphaera sp.]
MRFPSLLFAALIFALSAPAADWPQWRGPDRTGHVPAGAVMPTALPTEPKILWHLKIGDGYASPVVAGGKVFYPDNKGGQEVLHAVDVTSGKEIWNAKIDQAFTDNHGPSGPRCTPLVDDGRVYAQSCRGELRCLKATDGSPLWQINFTTDFSAIFMGENGNALGASRHGNNGSPVIDGDHLLVNVGGTNGESVVCFDKATGKVIWKSQNDQAGYAAPIIATIGGVKQLISFTVDGLMGLAAQDGKFLWRYPMKTSYGRHAITPVVVDDMVLVSSHEVGLVGLKISRKGDDWAAAQAWLSHDLAINFSSPVAVGNYLYGLGPSKNLMCVEIKTGKQTWSNDTYINTSADIAYAGFIVMDKNILALTDGGQLVLFVAAPEGFKETGTLQVCGKNWCNPAYADGKLFLRDARELMCVALLP